MKKITERIISLIFILLFLQATVNQLYAVTNAESSANSTAHSLTPKGVMEAFCKEDFKGSGGLGPKGWPSISEYTTWIDAPWWDTFVVISEYKVTSVKENLDSANVIVVYKVIGNLESTEKIYDLEKNVHTQKINYGLVKRNGQWKVENPQLPPHISKIFAIELIEKRIKKVTDKELLQQANDIIKFLKGFDNKEVD